MGDKLKSFDLQLFGGGGTKIVNEPAKIPEPTPEERELQREQLKYIQALNPYALQMLGLGNKALDNSQLDVDYKQLFSQGMDKINALGESYNDLLNGKVNPEFQKNREQAMQSGINNTLGSTLNNLSQRGVVNSKVMSKAMSSQQKNIADAMSQGYHNDISTQSQLLNQAEQSAYNPMMYANAAQNAALDIPKTYYSMAMGHNTPNNDAWKTMYGNRYSVVTPAQSYAVQNGGGFFGGLMSGVGAYLGACFIAGTKISAPDGDINIEDIRIGDIVYSLNEDGDIAEQDVVFVSRPKISADQYIKIITDKCEVITTATQPFITSSGKYYADELCIGDALVAFDDIVIIKDIIMVYDKEIVYDFGVGGENIYFANGFAVEGDKE